MLNFELILGTQYWSEGHGFKNVESTLSKDACGMFVHIVVIEKKILKHFTYNLNFEI